MNLRNKFVQLSLFCILVLIIGGVSLLYKGNDALAMGIAKKSGIVTAEQVNVSFDSVQGRLVTEAVKEGDVVHQGDVLYVLDSTDVDLQLAKVDAQIAQLASQIQSQQGSIRIGYDQANTNEEESRRAIDQQRAAIASAQATLDNDQRNYDRMTALLAEGAISRSDCDDAYAKLQVSQAAVRQQQEGLAKLLGGATDTGATNDLVLPSIAEARDTLANKGHDVAALVQQQKQLEVTKQELLVQKDRLTLRAPEDGKILKLIAKKGEMISPNTPVLLLESNRYYYDIYVSETQAAHLAEGQTLTGHTVAGNKSVSGTIRLLTKAQGFADLKMTREKGQADLTSFLVRIYPDAQAKVVPGMTVEVTNDEILK